MTVMAFLLRKLYLNLFLFSEIYFQNFKTRFKIILKNMFFSLFIFNICRIFLVIKTKQMTESRNPVHPKELINKTETHETNNGI